MELTNIDQQPYEYIIVELNAITLMYRVFDKRDNSLLLSGGIDPNDEDYWDTIYPKQPIDGYNVWDINIWKDESPWKACIYPIINNEINTDIQRDLTIIFTEG
jgi:hypothetical protein